jgi:hypothetical protein
MATATSRQIASQPARRGALRGRLLVSFMIPVLLLGAGAVVLLELVAAGGDLAGLPMSIARAILAGFILLALLVAAALALQAGDRLTRPVAWLLRAIDAGQVRVPSQSPPPVADWEMGMLCNRVRVLLRQNLSGAKAMEELEALREEIGNVLRAAEGGRLDPSRWPREGSTHELTRQLLAYFEGQSERVRQSTEGIDRLQVILEQDWRDETQAVEGLVRRAERAFLQQTQLAVEMERVERLFQATKRELDHWSELKGLVDDLRLGIERWRREVAGHLDAAGYEAVGGSPAPAAQDGRRDVDPRLRDWDAWVAESLRALAESLARSRAQRETTVRRIAGGLERVADVVAGSGQEVGGLSQEVAQLQRAWGRLGERLRSLMARVDEAHNGDGVPATTREEEPEGDAGR